MKTQSPAFSLVEILVVIAVIVILLALLLPAIGSSRASARAAQCSRQLDQIGKALSRSRIERTTGEPAHWISRLAPYVDDAVQILRCPDDPVATPGGGGSVALPGPGAKTANPSYGINSRAYRISGGDGQKIVGLEYKLIVANVVGPQGTDDWQTNVAPRHRGKLHVLYVDGSVQQQAPDKIDPRVCEIHDRLWRPYRDFSLVKPGCTNDVSLSPTAPPITTTTGSGAGSTTAAGSTTSTATTGTTTGGTTTGSTPTGPDPCTPPPEAAAGTPTAKALDWVVRHQFPGSGQWSMLPQEAPGCDGSCATILVTQNPIAATAMAILPMMGAGSTYKSGQYKENICKGINYLLAVQDPATGNLEGNFDKSSYAHLLATWALAEAVAAGDGIPPGGCPGSTTGSTTSGGTCTVDATLLRARAQLAINYTMAMQHVSATVNCSASGLPGIGGWRYDYGNGADISHHAWGVIALLTGRAAGLNVPQSSLDSAKQFLVAMRFNPQTHNGVTLGEYGYLCAYFVSNRTQLHACGLLSEVMLGAPTTHPKLQSFCANTSVSNRYYYNFHMTHLQHLVGGATWTQWNNNLKTFLQQTPPLAVGGHADGSWYQESGNEHTYEAGRHGYTCLMLLSLEQSFTRLRMGE